MKSKVISQAVIEGRRILLEPEAKRLCKEYRVPVTRFQVAKTEKEAVIHAKDIGYPVVLKVVSPQVVHKSDVGGVALELTDEHQVREAYGRIVENVKKKQPEATILGVIVEEMAKPGTEVIIGVMKDPQFGPCIMFGLGGVFVELLKDVAFRVCPVSKYDAREMVEEIQAYPILKGYRGSPPADLESLIKIIMNVSKMAVENQEIDEMDLNPVIVYEEGATVVDARTILSEGTE